MWVGEESDEQLAARAREGPPAHARAAFEALLDRHYDRVYKLAWRWSGSRGEAEDIAQDVCVKLAGAIRSFRGDALFKTWLYRIAYTTTLDHVRARQRMVSVEPSEIISLIDVRSAHDSPEDTALGADIWTAVRGLPPQQRDAVLLVYAEDMSHAEAAGVMGCSEKTVSWHIHEAKKRLKVLLEAVS